MTSSQVQQMLEGRPWIAAAVLQGTAAAISRSAIWRALAGELIGDFSVRSPTDAALVLLCPAARAAVEAYYAGSGPALRDVADPEELRVVDAWLAGEVRRWAARWTELDPARRGAAPSTRVARETLRVELEARAVPTAVAAVLALATPGRACPAPR